MKARNSSVSRGTYTTVHPHQPSAHHPSCRLRRALTPHGVHRPGRSTGPCGKCLINVREHHSSESYMSQHALNNLITHAAKQRPETRRARGITGRSVLPLRRIWPRDAADPRLRQHGSYRYNAGPASAIGSCFSQHIIVSRLCLAIYSWIYDQCAMAMRLPIPACTVAVQRACDAPQHICECERVGGGTGGDRPSLLLVSRQHSTAKQKLQKLTIAIGPRGRLSAHRVGADPARGPMTQTPVPFPSPSIDTSSQRNPPFPRRGGRSRKTACYDV
jgi:hypothetical protein